jgi:hypothetical protein
MARLGADAKAQYYPTPLSIIETAANMIHAPKGATIYDPCAGTGAAVALLARLTGMTAYGNELDAERAGSARAVLAECTVGPYETVTRTQGDRFSAVFFNPPYSDAVGNRGRLETLALPHALRDLATHGLLFGVLPIDTVRDYTFMTRLCATCDVVSVARFPGDLYDSFKQVVVLAVKRAKGTTGENVYVLMQRLGLTPQAPVRHGYSKPVPHALDEFTVEYVCSRAVIEVPGSRAPVSLINPASNPMALLTDAVAKGATATPTFRMLTRGRTSEQGRAQAEFRPLMPLKRGHASMLLAAGFLDGAEVTWEGRDYVVRGYSRKYLTRRSEIVGEKEETEKVFTRENFATVIVLVDAVNGAITELSPDTDKERYQAFLLDQADALTSVVQKRYPARYNPDSPDFADPVIDAVLARVKAPGKLAGRDTGGLLAKQAEVVRAGARSLRDGEKTIWFNARMGTGKTLLLPIAWAASEGKRMDIRGSNSPKAVVLCPAHLTRKWARHIDVMLSDFGARAIVCKKPSDVDAVFNMNRPGVAVLSFERSKMGNEWTHAANCRTVRGEVSRVADNGKIVCESTNVRVCACPKCGTIQHEIIRDEEGDAEDMMGAPYTWSDRDGQRVPDFGNRRNRCENEACGEPLWQVVPFKGGRNGRHALPKPGESRFNGGLAYGGGRAALAQYISSHYAGRYSVIGDEVHKLTASDTDRGYALMDLCAGAKKRIMGSGSWFNGKASAIFGVSLRTLPTFVERGFKYGDEASFVRAYGLIEQVEYRSASATGSTSSLGYSRREDGVRSKEIAGCQPDLMALILPNCLFLELADLGEALPPYNEYSVHVDLPEDEEIKVAFQSIATFLEQGRKEARKGDPTALSSGIQLALGFPYRMEGAEEIIHRRRDNAVIFSMEGRTMPAGGWPLDQLLVRYCRAERARGRKVLVYLGQMVRRDASGRLIHLLTQAGLRVGVLRPNVAAEGREAWLAAIEPTIDVLFTSAPLVETGLDLYAFPSIVNFGTERSIFTLQQSSRRSWRLGQTEPVEVSFWTYRGTLSHDALPTIARGLAAAARFNGNTAEGLAATSEEGDVDLVSALMRQVLTGTIERGTPFPTLTIPSDEEVAEMEKVSGVMIRPAPHAPALPSEVDEATDAVVAEPAAMGGDDWKGRKVAQMSLFDALLAA